uniref:Uncharacterized protein n=1 Tax=Moniliophthora roreri TaxID=221103 RepID=A0A0W0GAI5_MONRR
MIGIDIAGLMMLIRIYALYSNHKSIVAAVASILAAHIGINGWLLTKGIPVNHELIQTVSPKNTIHSCSMIFEANNHGMRVLAASTAWLPLVYDTAVFCLTFYKTYPKLRLMSTSRVMKQLLRDGIVYYGVILAVTLVLTLMIAYAPPGLQNVAAQLELLLTVTMMSRITLNLKKCNREDDAPVIMPLARISTNKTRPSHDIDYPPSRADQYYHPSY